METADVTNHSAQAGTTYPEETGGRTVRDVRQYGEYKASNIQKKKSNERKLRTLAGRGFSRSSTGSRIGRIYIVFIYICISVYQSICLFIIGQKRFWER